MHGSIRKVNGEVRILLMLVSLLFLSEQVLCQRLPGLEPLILEVHSQVVRAALPSLEPFGLDRRRVSFFLSKNFLESVCYFLLCVNALGVVEEPVFPRWQLPGI